MNVIAWLLANAVVAAAAIAFWVSASWLFFPQDPDITPETNENNHA